MRANRYLLSCGYYTATDGGANDEDGVENGIIVDPVSFAIAPAATVTTTTTSNVIPAPGSTSASGTLSETGTNSDHAVVVALTLILFGSAIAMLYRRRITFRR